MTNAPQIFVLEIDGRPTLAFEATSHDEARQICGDADLRTDLCTLASGGSPICRHDATLTSRLGTPDEIASFERALGLAPASEQPTMAFLIKIDGVVVVTTSPE